MSKKNQFRLYVDNMRFPCVGTNNNRKAEKRRVSALFERVKKLTKSFYWRKFLVTSPGLSPDIRFHGGFIANL